MIYFPNEARVVERKKKENVIPFIGFPLGENTSVPAFQLSPKELAECVNLKFNPGGQLETRSPFVVHSTGAAKGVWRDFKSCSLSGTQYTLCSDATKVYYMNSTVPTEIGTLGSPAEITPYNDVAVIADGSYLKYCDSTSSIKMAYDAGPSGTFYDNYAGDPDTTVDVATVAIKFTTPAWTVGYTIPPTSLYFHAKVSSGTEIATVTIYNTSDIEMASKVCTTLLTTSAAYVDVTFLPGDITNELAPDTDYYACVSATNLQMSVSTVLSGGVTYTHAGTWAHTGVSNVSTANPVMRVHPGVPPKADYCAVSGNRLMLKDPDYPGRVQYGNLTHLDWSTPDGGGWIGVIDDGANSFEIGGFQDLYGTLYVYGTQETPYLCQLVGDSPSAYSLPLLFQRIWATQRTLVNTNDNLWNASKDGVDPLTGVQEYGDLRTFSASDQILDRFSNWDSATAFAGYNAADGQYWLYMPTYNYISICHTKQPIQDAAGKTVYPWSRYKFPTGLTPTCFSQVGDDFLIGASNGYIYKLDDTEYKDLTTAQIAPSFKTSYIELPGKTIDLIQGQILVSSHGGSKVTLDILKNGNLALGSSILTKTIAVSMSDALTIAEIADLELADIEDIAIQPSGTPLYFDLNINCYAFQVRVSDIHIAGFPVFINGMIFTHRQLEA